MSFIKNPWLYVVAVGAFVIYFLICIDKSSQRKTEQMARAHPPKTAAETYPTITADPSVLHPVSTQKIGPGLDYNAPTPTPAPPAAATPTPAPVEYTPLIAFSAKPTPAPIPIPVPKAKPVEIWLPETNYIPCVLLGAVESSNGGDPVILGQVTEDVYAWNFSKHHLIIPAGSRVMAFAKNGYTRDRIFAKGEWRLVYIHEGTSLSFEGEACTMSFDPSTNMYGLDDRSPGIKGTLIESDSYVRLKALIGLLLKTAADGAVSWGTSALSHGNNNNSTSINTGGVSGLMDQYIQELVNGHHGTGIEDTLYVAAPAGIGFWILTLAPVEPGLRAKGGVFQKPKEENPGTPYGPLDPTYLEKWETDVRKQLRAVSQPPPQPQSTQPETKHEETTSQSDSNQ